VDLPFPFINHLSFSFFSFIIIRLMAAEEVGLSVKLFTVNYHVVSFEK